MGPRNLTAFTKQAGNHGGSGYPLLRMVALVACGTRTIIDAVLSVAPPAPVRTATPGDWPAVLERA